MLQLMFSPGLTLTGFQTTRPWSLHAKETRISSSLAGLCRLFLDLFFFCHVSIISSFMFGIIRSFIPKSDQPLFDILVGMNGEIMHTRRQPADRDLTDTAALGRFG